MLPTLQVMQDEFAARTAHSTPPMLTPASDAFGEKPEPHTAALAQLPPEERATSTLQMQLSAAALAMWGWAKDAAAAREGLWEDILGAFLRLLRRERKTGKKGVKT